MENDLVFPNPQEGDLRIPRALVDDPPHADVFAAQPRADGVALYFARDVATVEAIAAAGPREKEAFLSVLLPTNRFLDYLGYLEIVAASVRGELPDL